jgi:hypothetical protein
LAIPLAAAVGLAARLVGVACAVYAVTSDRLLDLRSLLRSGIGAAVVVLYTAAVGLLGIGLAQFLSGLLEGEARLAAVVSVARRPGSRPRAGKFFGKNTIDLQWKMRANYNARPCGGERNAAGAGTGANRKKQVWSAPLE